MDWLGFALGNRVEEMTWWQMCARALLVFAVGLLLLRVAGKRLRGRWAPLDLVVFIMVGSNLSRALTGNSALLPTLSATALLVALHEIVARAAVRWPALGPLLKGHARPLVQGGRKRPEALRQEAVGSGDLEEAYRAAGVRADEVEEAWLERDGQISVIRRSG